jgi:hypothetical protein
MTCASTRATAYAARRLGGRRELAASLIILALAAGAAPALADDAEAQALRKEVEELKQRVKALEGEHAPVASPPSASPAAATAPPPVAKPPPMETDQSPQAAPPAAQTAPAASADTTPGPLRAGTAPPPDSVAGLRLSWRKVKRGMSDTQIEDVLGPPSRDTQINGKRVWYYYYPGVGAGSVFFNSNGRVSSNQAPSIGLW